MKSGLSGGACIQGTVLALTGNGEKHKAYMREYCRNWRRRKSADANWRKKSNARQVEYTHRNPIYVLWSNARARARKRGTPFSIKREDIVIPDFCPVLGIALSKGFGTNSDNSPSVDEIVHGTGYVPGNVQVISWRANRIKSDATADELKRIAEYVVALRGG